MPPRRDASLSQSSRQEAEVVQLAGILLRLVAEGRHDSDNFVIVEERTGGYYAQGIRDSRKGIYLEAASNAFAPKGRPWLSAVQESQLVASGWAEPTSETPNFHRREPLQTEADANRCARLMLDALRLVSPSPDLTSQVHTDTGNSMVGPLIPIKVDEVLPTLRRDPAGAPATTASEPKGFTASVRAMYDFPWTCYRCARTFNLSEGMLKARGTLRTTQRGKHTSAIGCWEAYVMLMAENMIKGAATDGSALAPKIGRTHKQLTEQVESLVAVGLASMNPVDGSAVALSVCAACQEADPFGRLPAVLPALPAPSAAAIDDNGFAVLPPASCPTFADVGGMERVKEDLRNSIGLILQHPAEAARLRVQFNGVLLHGPPGTGKSYLAKAIAGEFGCGFIHVEVSQLISAFRGESAQRLAACFEVAKRHAPAVLFFDEFDALAQRREAGGQSSEDTQLLTQLLRSLEAIRDRSDVVVLAATNDLDALDPAITRPGRFDRRVRIDLPDRDTRRQIFEVQLRARPIGDDVDLDDLAQRTAGQSAAAITSVVNEAALHVLGELNAGRANRPIGQTDLLTALAASGGQDRPLVADWSWDDLVLPSATKRELMELQRLIENPERAARLGIQPPRGAILYGPPGTGKTTIARVLAAQARTSFYPVRGSEIISKWLGEAERNVAHLWERARNNAPSIIFLDEIDAVAPRRSASNDSGADQALNRVVSQLLQEIDGLSSGSGVFVLGATNRPEILDEALVRGGRLSRQIEIPLPDDLGRLALLSLLTRQMQLGAAVDLVQIAAATAGLSGADLQALCQQAGIHALMAETDDTGISASDFAEAMQATAPRRSGQAIDLGLCDWHGLDTPAGCPTVATEEVGRRQYCRTHAVAARIEMVERADPSTRDLQA